MIRASRVLCALLRRLALVRRLLVETFRDLCCFDSFSAVVEVTGSSLRKRDEAREDVLREVTDDVSGAGGGRMFW